MSSNDYLIRVQDSLAALPESLWDGLLAQQAQPTPFLRHAYLMALEDSGSAVPATGWLPQLISLWHGDALQAACVLYVKNHSYGEYVFDWAWAQAYQQHGLNYYPKAVLAVPFTPVPGARLLAVDAAAREALLGAVLTHCEKLQLSSLHLLFGSQDDLQACAALGLMQRHTVQFHWDNRAYRDFDDFLSQLNQEKRKKIRQERRKVEQAGVRFRWAQGSDISEADWDFFYRCYERTYLEHGNPPYLSRAFFAAQALHQSESWLLFIAERDGQAMASSLIALQTASDAQGRLVRTAYGRYWGALERVDCLHFEACYYQPLAWCIDQGYDRFEGGAQGEHKMARALMPVNTHSAHWLAHPAFADAVQRFLEREGEGIQNYLEDLRAHSPFKAG
ncbi:GNAT family N-acetyltransferase [Curvibacter sp. HBC28]|uniref:GNAT family N-acetyltransferase n=1 Tax=Curvibacter microcysteis TaxID=3026419 RepID=A0ABT5MEN8_9BURK|nr:GNAT family N-acetyltransferase [Curvibacter sp. HBC28]MDD0814459.1 GNAT family N-acetyltransferase [Curvibacter sp. HBC28]